MVWKCPMCGHTDPVQPKVCPSCGYDERYATLICPAKNISFSRVYLKTQNCTKRQEKDIKGFYHRQYKEVIA